VNLLFAARRLRQVWWMRIAIGVAMSAIAFFVRWLIKVDGFPFITFFPAVLAAGMLGGVTAGTICTMLGLFAARYYFTSPSFYLGLNTATSLVPILLFMLAAGIELLLIGLLNRAIDELWLAREHSSTLFRELQHRVANNLQFVAALLHLQRKLPLSKDDALASANERLEIMGRIHRKLYDPENADRPITEFLRDLCGDLIQSSGVSNITLNVIDAPLKLSFEKIIPLALMVAEIVTNSLKHAFPGGRPGFITIALRPEPPPLCTLVVADDGIGFADAASNAQQGLGRRVIESLAAQLEATTLSSTDHGARVAITFRP
jgi:two-component sensor histidine kinase